MGRGSPLPYYHVAQRFHRALLADSGRLLLAEVVSVAFGRVGRHEGICGEDCQDALLDFFSGEPFPYCEGAVEVVSERAAPAQV